MVDGLEHFAKAEALLEQADADDVGSPEEVSSLAYAQVHATLALAAAANEELAELRAAVQEYLVAFDGPRIDQAMAARDRLRELLGGAE